MSICSLRKGRAVRILAVAGVAALLGTRGALATSLTWDKAGASPTKPVDGAGTWDLTHADWSNGSTDSAWVNGSNIAVFGNANGAAGAITLGTNITAGGLTFNPASSGNYSIVGSSQLSLDGFPTITVNSAQATISVPMAATDFDVAGTGNGSLTLAGNMDYVGQIHVNSGTVIVGSTGALSSSNIITVASGAAVQVNASTTINNGFNNSGTVTVAGGQTLTIGTLGFTQNGTLTINGSMLLSSSTATEGAFSDNGGTITGTVTFGTAPSEIGFGSAAGPGNFQVNSSSCELVNDNTGTGIPTGANITMQSPSGIGQLTVNTGDNYNYGTITLTAANNSYAILGTPSSPGVGGAVEYGSIANYGTITLAQAGTATAYGSQLNGTMFNEPTGVININTSIAENGIMDNGGTLNIAAGQTFSFTSSEPQFSQGGTLNIYGVLQMGSGSFFDAGGTITGTVTLGYDGSVSFGPSSGPGTFLFNGGEATITTPYQTAIIPSGVNVSVQGISGIFLDVGYELSANNGSLTVTGDSKGYTELSHGTATFTNNGTITLGASSTPTSPSLLYLTLANSATGSLNINTSTTAYYGMTNSGAVAIAAGQTLNFTPTSATAAPTVPFDQIAGTVTVGAGGTLAIAAGQQLEISGGTILLTAGTLPGVVTTASVLWPKPANALNPATDLASISTTAVGVGQLAGQINLGGGETPFNIADPNATLTVSASITNGSVDKTGPGTLVLMGAQGFTGVLNDDAGILTIGQGASLSASQITVASGAMLNVIGSLAGIVIIDHGTVNFPATASGFHPVTVLGLALTSGLKSTVAAAGSTANRTVLELSSLTFGGTSGAWQGLLDLTSNDMVVHGGSVATLNGYISQGYNSGGWNGSGGIVSSTAAANHTTALGIELNSAGGGVLLSSFDGQPVTSTDVLIKYTFYGDADLSGTVTGSDYTLIDTGFNNQYTGWHNGDFNYDNVINGNDYTLIDNAFNNQGGITYAAVGAGPSDLIATATEQVVVPEPATLAVIPLAAFLFRRRRVQRQA